MIICGKFMIIYAKKYSMLFFAHNLIYKEYSHGLVDLDYYRLQFFAI